MSVISDEEESKPPRLSAPKLTMRGSMWTGGGRPSSARRSESRPSRASRQLSTVKSEDSYDVDRDRERRKSSNVYRSIFGNFGSGGGSRDGGGGGRRRDSRQVRPCSWGRSDSTQLVESGAMNILTTRLNSTQLNRPVELS